MAIKLSANVGNRYGDRMTQQEESTDRQRERVEEHKNKK
jgi:hypothetical protein